MDCKSIICLNILLLEMFEKGMETQSQLEDQAFLTMRPTMLAEPSTAVDVFIMTRNSARFLDGCLRSVEHGVNVNRLIVIDGGSTDDTLEIARHHGAEIINDGGLGLGYARKLAADLCESEWICFIDADVELLKDWHNRMMRYATPDVGAIVSIALTAPLNEYERRIARIINHRRTRRKACNLMGRSAWGFTGASLIRNSLLSDLMMPPVKCMEDYVITQHILRRARWLWVPVFIRHYDRFSERPDRSSQTWATARFIRLMGTIRFLIRRTTLAMKSLLISIAYREPLYFIHYIRDTIYAFRGWFHWNKYIKKSYPTGYMNPPQSTLVSTPTLELARD